jgi:hypothetical protein
VGVCKQCVRVGGGGRHGGDKHHRRFGGGQWGRGVTLEGNDAFSTD